VRIREAEGKITRKRKGNWANGGGKRCEEGAESKEGGEKTSNSVIVILEGRIKPRKQETPEKSTIRLGSALGKSV